MSLRIFVVPSATSLVCACILFADTATAAPITALAFSPDATALVSSGSRSLEIRSAKDGTVLRRVPCELQKITSLAFHPRGHLLAAAGGTPWVVGSVQFYGWPELKASHALTNHTDLATCVAFNGDGTLLGVASADHSARVWRIPADGSAPREAFALMGHAGPVLAIAFSPAGTSVVTASVDRSLKVWSTEDGRLLNTFSYHTDSIHAVAFRPRDTEQPAMCASAGDDRTVRVWQPEIGRMVRIVRQHQGPIFALAYSPDGKTLFSAGQEGIIRRIDPDSDTILSERPVHRDWIYALALSPDGSRIATGDWSGEVIVSDATR